MVHSSGLVLCLQREKKSPLRQSTSLLYQLEVVRLERGQALQKAILRFDELNPMSGKIAHINQDALALIVGISEYDRTNAPAIFADNDAQFFQDYAALKLGIPENNITTLVNGNAEQADVLLSVKNWLSRAVKQEQSDVYIFFAGHGLTSTMVSRCSCSHMTARQSFWKTPLFLENAYLLKSPPTHAQDSAFDTCYSGTFVAQTC